MGSKVKAWKRRWFILKNGEILYYKSPVSRLFHNCAAVLERESEGRKFRVTALMISAFALFSEWRDPETSGPNGAELLVSYSPRRGSSDIPGERHTDTPKQPLTNLSAWGFQKQPDMGITWASLAFWGNVQLSTADYNNQSRNNNNNWVLSIISSNFNPCHHICYNFGGTDDHNQKMNWNKYYNTFHDGQDYSESSRIMSNLQLT